MLAANIGNGLVPQGDLSQAQYTQYLNHTEKKNYNELCPGHKYYIKNESVAVQEPAGSTMPQGKFPGGHGSLYKYAIINEVYRCFSRNKVEGAPEGLL